MPTFTRAWLPGGTFFFTVVTYRRRRLFWDGMARRLLRGAFQRVHSRRPYTTDAIVLLPDHLHCLWTLPEGDSQFSTRWRKIKELFTDGYLAQGGRELPVTPGQARKGMRGIWQPRFWEHTIRDEEDYRRHVDYIHYNPVKHGYASCPHAWAWSSFSRWVDSSVYERNWCCECQDDKPPAPNFKDIEQTARE